MEPWVGVWVTTHWFASFLLAMLTVWGTFGALHKFLDLFRRRSPVFNIKIEAQGMSPEATRQMVTQAIEEALANRTRPTPTEGRDVFARLEADD